MDAQALNRNLPANNFERRYHGLPDMVSNPSPDKRLPFVMRVDIVVRIQEVFDVLGVMQQKCGFPDFHLDQIARLNHTP